MSAAYAVRGAPAAPNGPLRDAAVLRAREDGTPVLELVDVSGRLRAEDLDRILVTQVVGSLDRVERVRLRVVLGRVPEGSVDAAFRRSGVAAGRMELGDDCDVCARVECLDRGTHAGAAGTDDEDVVLWLHR